MPLAATKEEVIVWEITNNLAAYNIHTLKRRVLFSGILWPAANVFWLNHSVFNSVSQILWVPYGKMILQISLQTEKLDTIFLPDLAGQCYALLEDEGQLLAASSTGLYRVANHKKDIETIAWA